MITKASLEPQDKVVEVVERGYGDGDLLILREVGLSVKG